MMLKKTTLRRRSKFEILKAKEEELHKQMKIQKTLEESEALKEQLKKM